MKTSKSKIRCGGMLVILVLALVVGLPAGVANADFIFGEPVNLGPTVNSGFFEDSPCISADGLSLFFASYNRPGGFGLGDIWLSTRATTDDDWSEPENLGPIVNGPNEEYQPAISTDGLELYFNRIARASQSSEIWVTTRASTSEPWIQTVKLDLTVDTTDTEGSPSLSADGLELYFCFGKWALESSLAVTKRDTKDSPWGVPVSLGPVVNSWTCQVNPRISSDGLLLLFSDLWMCSPRPGGFGADDMWLTRRASKDSDWGEPINLGQPVNTEFYETGGMISADGSILYFNGNSHDVLDDDLWQASIEPVVDLNTDGIVDSANIVIMIDNWGTDDPLCDIGPMPWGDGVVDVEDLIVLAEHLFEEIPPVE